MEFVKLKKARFERNSLILTDDVIIDSNEKLKNGTNSR